MTKVRSQVVSRLLSLGLIVTVTSPVGAQVFNSGSTGALGALAPSTDTTVPLPPDGILNYTTVTIPAGVTVKFTPNAAKTPVTVLAQGTILINGTVHVNGSAGLPQTPTALNAGGAPGPGGFAGGNGGMKGQVNLVGSSGQGPGGGSFPPHGTYGTFCCEGANFNTMIPLFGGSGGNGGPGDANNFGASGGGGSGAMVIASTTQIMVGSTGVIRANGGASGDCSSAGQGSGGAIRLVAPSMTSSGTIESRGGGCIGGTSFGRVRLEYQTSPPPGIDFSHVYPSPYTSTTLGPITAASTPPLQNLPTVTITAVSGIPVPANPGGSFTPADVTVPGLVSNPVAVTLTANNIPVGTVFQVRVIPQFGQMTTVDSTASTGTFATSTATANVTLPYGGVTSLLDVYGNFTLAGP